MQPQIVFDDFKVEDDDGTFIPLPLLTTALHFCGFNPAQEDVDALTATIDTNHNGRIELDEFNTYCNTMHGTRPSQPALQDAFRHFDADGNGYLDRDEMRTLLSTGDHALTDAEVDRAVAIADVNGDGQIDYEEFVRMLCGAPPPDIADDDTDDEDSFAQNSKRAPSGKFATPGKAGGEPTGSPLTPAERVQAIRAEEHDSEVRRRIDLAQQNAVAMRRRRNDERVAAEEKRKRDEEEEIKRRDAEPRQKKTKSRGCC
jgi:calmodulin